MLSVYLVLKCGTIATIVLCPMNLAISYYLVSALLPGVVKRIIPAVASTNAVIAGEVIYFKIPVCINLVLCRPTRASDVNIDL